MNLSCFHITIDTEKQLEQELLRQFIKNCANLSRLNRYSTEHSPIAQCQKKGVQGYGQPHFVSHWLNDNYGL